MVEGDNFNDLNQEDKFPNITAIHNVLRHANRFKLFLVIDANDICMSDGSSLIKFMTYVSTIIDNNTLDDIDSLSKYIVPIITKFNST